MLQNIKKRSEGFTIIEVMIVLAIAGLIMLVVFLAVPALQRNSRNSSRRSDAGRVASAINEWQTNNSGAVLTAGANNVNLTTILTSAGDLSEYTMAAAANLNAPNAFTIATGQQAAMPAGTNNQNLGSMQVVTGASCGTGGATVANASNRRVALQYLLETAGGVTAQCLEVG